MIRENMSNDLMAQCFRKLLKVSEEETQKRIDEIKNCDHLFVKLRDYDNPNSQNVDLAVVECVHCGVTNKFMDLECTFSRYSKSLEYYMIMKYHRNDLEYNCVTVESVLMREIDNKTIQSRLMSNHVLRSLHPNVLYEIAKLINPDADNEELFAIMVKLNEIETPEERNRITNLEDAYELIERYNELKGKAYIK